MIDRIIPQFFTTKLEETFKWYKDKLGFETDFIYGEPPSYGGMVRDGQRIFFRHQDAVRPFEADKYEAEYLDAMIEVQNIDELYKEMKERGADMAQDLSKTEWGAMAFTVRDCDGRLLCFAEM